MSALFDLHATDAPEFATTPNLTAPPSKVGERFSADLAGTNTSDRFWNMQKAQAEGYGKIIDDVHALTGERLPNPAANDATMDEIRENAGQPYPMIFQKRLDKLRAKTRELRSSMPEGGYGTEPGYLDPDMVNTRIATESRGAREAAQRLEGTGGGIGAFAGAAVGEMFNPFNILASFIPATRAPVWISEQAIGLFMRNVGREAAYQAVTQGGVQVLSSSIDYASRSQIGTQQTAGEFAGEVLGAAGLGFVIGGAARATVPAWLQVRRMWGAGEYVPTAVKDAAITLEGRALYGDKNPLGLPASANESALDKAVIDVALNRPADVSGIIPPTAPAGAAAPAPTVPAAPRLVVAREMPDGTIRYGKPGEIHADLVTPAELEARPFFPPSEEAMGFAEPGGKFMSRQEAADFVRTNEPERGQRLHEETGLQAEQYQRPTAEAAAPTPAAEAAPIPLTPTAPAPSSTGLAEFGGTAKDITGQLYDGLFAALQKGETKFAGITDPVLRDARADFDAGRIKSAEDLADFVNKRGAFAEAVSPELQRLQKMADEIAEPPRAPGPAAQTPPTATQRPIAPPPEQPAVAKAPGESPEDKATLDQAKQLIESPDFAVPSEKRAAYNDALKQEQEARVAAGCLGGGAI